MQLKLTSLPPWQCWWNESNTFYVSCTRYGPPGLQLFHIEQFSYDLEMKTHKQNRKNKQTEMEQFDWFIKRIQMSVAFGWLILNAQVKKLHAQELSRNQPILCFDVELQNDWPIEQSLLRIRVFFGGKTKRLTNTYRDHFSWSYKNHSNCVHCLPCI